MRYSWASITQSCTNFGNFTIEQGVTKLLEELGVPKPHFIFDSFKAQDQSTINEINSTDFVIVPGCLTLVTKYYTGLESVLPSLKVPIYNLGAAFGGVKDNFDLEFVKFYHQPIASRDPFTHDYLTSHGIKSELTGCPTLFLGQAKKHSFRSSNKVIFVFGVGQIKEQQKVLDYLIESKYDVQVIIQEDEQRQYIKGKAVTAIEYNPEKLLKIISESRLMVTGRLHGALPALTNGLPVFFIQTISDFRFSLLDYLGVPLFPISDPDLIGKLRNQITNFSFSKDITLERIQELKTSFNNYVGEIIKAESKKTKHRTQ